MHTSASRASLLPALRPRTQEGLYDFYKELRSTDDLFWDRHLDAWIATSHAVVSSTAGDPRFSSVRYPDIAAVSEELKPLARVLSRQMLYSDAPDHPRLRALLSKAFTPRAVATLRDRISVAVEQIITRAAPTGRMDIVADLARPLPLNVICDLLGVPEPDRPTLSSWSDPIAAAIGSSRLDADDSRAASQSMERMLAYLRELLTRRDSPPAPHTLRALLTTRVDSTDQDFDELLANCALLLIAGHETTTHFIGNAALALLRHPQAADQLRHRTDLIPAAVEELLRYDSPVQLMLRRARHDLDLAGRAIAAGQVVLLVCGAANRDPAAFPDPDVLDFQRPGGRHVAFGYGPHFCLGAALARLEGTIVLEALLTRLPDLRLAGTAPQWQRSLNFRALTRLDVAFTPVFG
ncbi:biotin biosynthesis cytochrome P450 [Streptomyces spinoverrucosus]|uniref:Biotin biosynthesis cytochrome P450 n=1 Tax=Streptomyces spinoverrucosus TaxID=284043 RepID=A0A4Y3VDG2_9ACTN|nr:cytochrome P450 [Streptomyces spinoverrucosus]GEC03621.1 biotin biosynthesis cytochrome P450 [Streptomyces spinoverrucosus]GHB51263.1 biotin biosynthesis cytochrome P450 [Streptomyces spinoverrucosus]